MRGERERERDERKNASENETDGPRPPRGKTFVRRSSSRLQERSTTDRAVRVRGKGETCAVVYMCITRVCA